MHTIDQTLAAEVHAAMAVLDACTLDGCPAQDARAAKDLELALEIMADDLHGLSLAVNRLAFTADDAAFDRIEYAFDVTEASIGKVARMGRAYENEHVAAMVTDARQLLVRAENVYLDAQTRV